MDDRSSLDFEGSLLGLNALSSAPAYRPPAEAPFGGGAPRAARGGFAATAPAQWGGGAPLSVSSARWTTTDVAVEPPQPAPPPASSMLLRARRGSVGAQGGSGQQLAGPRALGSAGKEPKRPALRVPPPRRLNGCCCEFFSWLWV